MYIIYITYVRYLSSSSIIIVLLNKLLTSSSKSLLTSYSITIKNNYNYSYYSTLYYYNRILSSSLFKLTYVYYLYINKNSLLLNSS